jgi:hypothetical protein
LRTRKETSGVQQVAEIQEYPQLWIITRILSTVTLVRTRSSETLVLTAATQRNIPEDSILHSHRRENLNSYIALTGWALSRRRNASPVRYEICFYIPEDAILLSHSRENLKSYIALTGWALSRRRNVSPVRYELGFLYSRRRHSS